jgi:hypothetical protein
MKPNKAFKKLLKRKKIGKVARAYSPLLEDFLMQYAPAASNKDAVARLAVAEKHMFYFAFY